MKNRTNEKRKLHFQTKVLIVSLLIVCVMAGAIGGFWYRQTSKQAQHAAERYIGSVLERLNGSFETMMKDVDHLVICASIDTNHIINPMRGYADKTPAEKLSCNQTILDTMLGLYQFKTYLEGMMISSVNGNYYRVGAILPYAALFCTGALLSRVASEYPGLAGAGRLAARYRADGGLGLCVGQRPRVGLCAVLASVYADAVSK